MYQTLLTELHNNILFITINRPDKMNAINSIVMDELGKVVAGVYENENIKAAIITGSGAKAFVAGADISEFSGIEEEGFDLSRKGQDIFLKIEQSPKPFLAAINGFALGAGCELAMSCHIRIASANAKFGQPEVNLGLIPGYGGTQRLAQLVGKGRAMELLLTGNLIDAQTALAYGLVTHIADSASLLDKAKQILEHINTKGPKAIAGCIKAINAVFDEKQDGFLLEATLFSKCFSTEDMKEGKTAFLEKRKANFKNR